MWRTSLQRSSIAAWRLASGRLPRHRVRASTSRHSSALMAPRSSALRFPRTCVACSLVPTSAAELGTASATADCVYRRVHEACRSVRMFGTLRTLKYLARGGHVPSIAASVSGLLDVRPILELRSGEVHRYALARTESHVLTTFREIAERELPKGQPLWVLAFHSSDEQAAQSILEAVASVTRVARAEVIPLTPALGAHTGPGMSGFAAMPAALS